MLSLMLLFAYSPLVFAEGDERCEGGLVIGGVDMLSGGRILVKEAGQRSVPWTAHHLTSMAAHQYNDANQQLIRDAGYVARLDGTIDFHALTAQIENSGHVPAFFTAGIDHGVPLADRLNYYFGLPGNHPDTTGQRTNKFEMNDAVSHAPEAIPGLIPMDQVIVSDPMQLVPFVQVLAAKGITAGILKPLNSSGTDLVREWHSLDEAIAIARSVLGGRDKKGRIVRELVAQRKLLGPEYAIDTVSLGTHHLINVFKYEKVPIAREQGGFSMAYRAVDILDPASAISRKLFYFITSVHRATGLNVGFDHAEVMVDPTTGGMGLVELNPRPSGWPFAVGVENAVGTNQVRAMFDLLEGAAEPHIGKPFQPTRIVFLITPRSGILRRVPTSSDFQALPSFKYLDPWIQVNSTVQRTGDTATIPAILVLSHPDEAQVMRDFQRVLEIERTHLVVE